MSLFLTLIALSLSAWLCGRLSAPRHWQSALQQERSLRHEAEATTRAALARLSAACQLRDSLQEALREQTRFNHALTLQLALRTPAANGTAPAGENPGATPDRASPDTSTAAA
jgi:hypothetical protein